MKQFITNCHSNISLLFLLLVISFKYDTSQSFSFKPCKHGRKPNVSFPKPNGINGCSTSSIQTNVPHQQGHGHGYDSFPLQMSTSPTTTTNTNVNTITNGVIFRYSASSFDHLKTIQESNASQPKDSTRTSTSTATTTTTDNNTTPPSKRLPATIGALTLASLTGILTLLLTHDNSTSTSSPNDDNPLFLVTSVAAGVAGWKLSGGDSVREAEQPKDGGYDARFVVDLPVRLSFILDRIREEEEFCVALVQSPSILHNSRDGVDGGDTKDRQRMAEQQQQQVHKWVERVHDAQYLRTFRDAVADAKETNRVRRLNPTVMRTLIDAYSYDAAVNSVMDWMHAVDTAMKNPPQMQMRTTMGDDGDDEAGVQRGTVEFALVRPPSHHACKSRGMGGCMLNSVAIAAQYALEEKGAKHVAILDIDAHHGNGIAHCIQEEGRVRYCSIHEVVVEKNWFQNEEDVRKKEESDDPRGAGVNDCGPLGNILNVPLDKKTGWDNGYRDALVEKALPFLLGVDEEGRGMDAKPDILMVACGFDALSADRTSSLQLLPEDYAKIGSILYDHFGCRVAFGLEGGYCWEGGELGEAVVNLVKPWSSSS